MLLANEYLEPASPLRRAFWTKSRPQLEALERYHKAGAAIQLIASGRKLHELPTPMRRQLLDIKEGSALTAARPVRFKNSPKKKTRTRALRRCSCRCRFSLRPREASIQPSSASSSSSCLSFNSFS
jgi:hypothetical protein